MTMKKIFLTVAICAIAAASVNAQVIKGAEAQTKRGPYETNRLFDNVFIGAAGGVNMYQGMTTKSTSPRDLLLQFRVTSESGSLLQ